MTGHTYLAYDYPLLSMFWTLLWFFLWIMWFILLFRIIGDIFLIARGKGMGAREIAHAQARQRAFDEYVRDRAGEAGGRSSADELARLSEMRNRGDIDDDEFRRAKELVLSGAGPTAGASTPPSSGSRV